MERTAANSRTYKVWYAKLSIPADPSPYLES